MQLDFKFENKNNYHPDDFIVFEGNREAFDFVSGKLDDFGESRVFMITGGEKSGKTYLANIWRKKAGVVFLDFRKMNKIKDLGEFYRVLMDFVKEGGNYILEDLEDFRKGLQTPSEQEEKLFHLINVVNEKGARLLITSKKLVGGFFFEIKDLQSRFQNIINFRIGLLDEMTKKLYIVKLFADKQMRVDDKVVDFLVKNTSVVWEEVFEMVERVVREFLRDGKRKKITVKFLKGIASK